MEVRTQSKTGPQVGSLSEIVSHVSQQVRDHQGEWLAQLVQDPGCLGELELRVHETFRHLADQVVAGLLARASGQSPALEQEKKK